MRDATPNTLLRLGHIYNRHHWGSLCDLSGVCRVGTQYRLSPSPLHMGNIQSRTTSLYRKCNVSKKGRGDPAQRPHYPPLVHGMRMNRENGAKARQIIPISSPQTYNCHILLSEVGAPAKFGNYVLFTYWDIGIFLFSWVDHFAKVTTGSAAITIAAFN